MDDNFPYSEEFQLSILKMMGIDDVFAAKCCIHLKEQYFNNDCLAWFFRTVKNYYGEFKKSPSISTMENEARKQGYKDQPTYFEVIKKVYSANEFDPEYIRNELTGFIRRTIFVESHKTAATLYNAHNTESAYDFSRRKMDELDAADFDKEEIIDFSRVWGYIDDAAFLSEHSVPTGITPIDKILTGGGLTPGSLTTLLSGTNMGKSMALMNMAYHAMRKGKKIVSIIHEDEENPTILRIVSRITGIPFNKLNIGRSALSPIEAELVDCVKKKVGESWHLRFMYGAQTTVEEVRDWLHLHKKQFDFDIIFDDYGQFIRTKIKTDGERFSQMLVYRTLKQIALELKVPVVTCAQGNREGQKIATAGVDYLHAKDLSECFDIARCSSIIITLNRSEEMERNNELVYYLEKQRGGKKGIAVKCKTDFARCMTHDGDPEKKDRMYQIDTLVSPNNSDDEDEDK